MKITIFHIITAITKLLSGNVKTLNTIDIIKIIAILF